MIDYKELIPADFASDSRVWVYQSSRLFMMSEALHIEDLLNNFTANWNSHGSPVKGYGNLLFGQFIVLMADERATGVSGCSTDSSVRLIKQIEQLFNVNMFDRQMLTFQVKDKVQMLPLNQLQYAIDNNFITPDTLYFNNLVQTKEELVNNWLIPVKDSWLAKRVSLSL
ncbi:hypothetical protein A4H97_17020 [Niastella yeongjuensis]|uniref:ABC transporter ATPase n=1 Tax=Niastella yeongjuensis TaxID=354355 RepID=A0A1V9E1D5_9BACT|nr:hypothetical protein [Niastella yeongjuensis]OQP39920.1 hypothetical protein A4H97_17020 [Niastella yeongjuensis]SEO10201.1 hypothetical protein SAMN05660816_02149 [Niastella yeongjuensis]